MKISILFNLISYLCLSFTSQAGELSYCVTQITGPDFDSSAPVDINEKGQILLGAIPRESLAKGDARHHVYLYDKSGLKDIGMFRNMDTIPVRMNSRGQIIGYGRNQSFDKAYPFIWTNGEFKDLGLNDSAYVTAINEEGVVVGYTDRSYMHPSRAFFYKDGVLVFLDPLGNGTESEAWSVTSDGSIVGITDPCTFKDWYSKLFVFSGGRYKIVECPKDWGLSSIACNDNGDVVGACHYLSSQDLNTKGFRYSVGWKFFDNPLGEEGGSFSFGAVNNNSEAVGTVDFINPQTYCRAHALVERGGKIYDLNDLEVIPSGWLLWAASGINETGQIVAIGIREDNNEYQSLLLEPIDANWRTVIEKAPDPPESVQLIEKQPGKDSLILVTHGLTWKGLYPVSPPNPDWVESVSNDITAMLNFRELNNWQVFGYKWIKNSWQWTASAALENAEGEGRQLGKSLATQGWKHIHLIAHSAGSALIQAATEVIKNTPGNQTVIHETFLDAFVGCDYAGVTNYGHMADWADSYYAQDWLTGTEAWPYTESLLDHACNIEVTYLDDNKIAGSVNVSTPSGTEICTKTVSSHEWPVKFYQNTIPPNIQHDSREFGFPLSKEGGNWELALNNHPLGRESVCVLGTPDNPSCSQLYESTPMMLGPRADFSAMPIIVNDHTKVDILDKDSFAMHTGSPAWIACFFSLTNTVNLIAFDVRFNSADMAEGLLSVYWDTNMLGSLHEVTQSKQMQWHVFRFPRSDRNGSHSIGFRLDPLTSIQSRVTITNVMLGCVGPSEQFTLGVLTNKQGNFRVLELAGQPGYTYTVEVSTNLIIWEAFAVLVNTNGTVRFTDGDAINLTRRFYRAVSN